MSFIPLLVERFRDLFAKEHGQIRSTPGVTPAALNALMAYDWPGNVRELKNVIESAILFAPTSRIDVGDLNDTIRAKTGIVTSSEPSAADYTAAPASPGTLPGTLVGKTMAEIEREAILTALQVSGGNRRRAAEMLDIGLRTLQRKLKEYRGEAPGDDDEDEGEDTES